MIVSMPGRTVESRNLGPVLALAIRSSVGSLNTLPEYVVPYPTVVIEALGQLYQEYNRAFAPLVGANREWDTDYQHCFYGPKASPVNFGVQIDMLGLSPEFLELARGMRVDEARELLRGVIFEIESSLAMYQVTERLCEKGSGGSNLKMRWRAALSDLRQRFGKPIALLAVTQQKYDAMLESEFGKVPGDTITDAEVQELSGFDRFFGPEDFRAYVEGGGGECDYLLYVRSSDPVDKLKKPDLSVDHPLLGDPVLRRVIKARSITFNIDAPEMDPLQRINDTKGYMPAMGMAFPIERETDLLSVALQEHLASGRTYQDFHGGSRLSPEFAQYLAARGISLERVESGEVHLRAKPSKGAYGCYGHVTGPLSAAKEFRAELRRNMRQRGGYVIQPEMETPCLTNTTDRQTYTYIDRNFLTYTDGRPVFLGGVRMLLPTDSIEAQRKRIHGNGATVFAEIVSSP